MNFSRENKTFRQKEKVDKSHVKKRDIQFIIVNQQCNKKNSHFLRLV